MANTLAALSSPPLMTNLSVCTTLRMRLISTQKPLARGKLSMCEWFDAYVLTINNILTITPIMFITSPHLHVQQAALYKNETKKSASIFVCADKTHCQIQNTIKALVMPKS